MCKKSLGKLVTNALCVSIVAAMLAGCGGEKVDSAADNVTEEVSEVATEDVSEDTASVEDTSSQESADETESFPKAGDYSSVPIEAYDGVINYRDTYYVLDQKGNHVDTFRFDELADNLYDPYTDFYLFGYYEGIYYYKCKHNESQLVFAYDNVTGKQKCVMTAKASDRIECVYNNDRLCITVTSDDDQKANSFHCFEKEKGQLIFTEVEPKYAKVYRILKDKELVSNKADLGINSTGYETVLDTYGYLIYKDADDKYYKIDTDCNVTELTGIKTINNIPYFVYGYDDEYVVYEADFNSYYRYDIKTSKRESLDIMDGASGIEYYHGRLFYYVDQAVSGVGSSYKIYYCDIKDNKSKLYCERQSVPGNGSYSASWTAKFFNDMTFFTELVGSDVKMFHADINGNLSAKVDTGIIVEHLSTLDYGTVECIEKETDCPFCGTQLSYGYVEYPVFNEDLIRNADIINAKIKGSVDELTRHWGEISSNDPYIKDNSCTHADGDFDALDTDGYDEKVESISLLEDRYLCIDTVSSSWPGDDLPSDCQKVYDTFTGKEISFADIYTGPGAKLKKVLATKAREDYQNCNRKDHFPYYAERSDEVYDMVYETADIKSDFFFTKDGIVYRNEDYRLYNMAYGYKDYLCSYYELLGRDGISTEERTPIYSPYGKVETANAIGCCPHCGEALYRYYAETFVLDGQYSPFAEAINNVMRSKTDLCVANVTSAFMDITDSNCGDHSSALQDYDSNDCVEDVRIIDGRYLAVHMSKYDHSIDAPEDRGRYEYLFDLQTGEQLSFKDFYTGSEEDFKKLMATKLVENFRSYCAKERITFTQTDADDAYKSAYEHASLENLWTGQNGIKYYYHTYNFKNCPYPEYSMVDTLVDFYVNYQDLLGKSTLSK